MRTILLLALYVLQSFEVASVRLAPPSTGNDFEDGRRAGMATFGLKITGNRAVATHNTLKQLICQAYGLKDHQVSAPAFASSEHFDITATLPADVKPGDAPKMLRALLAERFGLTSHQEEREIPVYALVVGKGGSKLLEPGAPAPMGVAAETAARGKISEGTPGVLHMRRASIDAAGIAEQCTRFTDRPVVDMTGLAGKYRLDLTFSVKEDGDVPGLFTAVQEQLGLKLEARKVKMNVLVVDQLEKLPKDN